jgi:hypothetical protein
VHRTHSLGHRRAQQFEPKFTRVDDALLGAGCKVSATRVHFGLNRLFPQCPEYSNHNSWFKSLGLGEKAIRTKMMHSSCRCLVGCAPFWRRTALKSVPSAVQLMAIGATNATDASSPPSCRLSASRWASRNGLSSGPAARNLGRKGSWACTTLVKSSSSNIGSNQPRPVCIPLRIPLRIPGTRCF